MKLESNTTKQNSCEQERAQRGKHGDSPLHDGAPVQRPATHTYCDTAVKPELHVGAHDTPLAVPIHAPTFPLATAAGTEPHTAPSSTSGVLGTVYVPDWAPWAIAAMLMYRVPAVRRHSS